MAFGHFVVKFDIVGKNDGSVGLNDADVADGRDNIVFLVVNDLVGLQRLVFTSPTAVMVCMSLLSIISSALK